MISGEQSLEGSLNGSSSLMGVLNSEGGTKDYNVLNNKPQINNVTLEGNLSSDDLGIQDLLVSGQNIKTINNDSILGEGNIEINPTDVQVNGTSITSSGVANLITNTEYDATNNKLATMSDMPDLTNYVQRTTYPTPESTGVIKTGNYFLTNLGVPYVSNLGYEVYKNANNNIFISKGTLENVIEGKNLENQVSILPTASEDNVGKIYQYVGATDANYTNGYFYQCISDGATTPAYSWEQINVQPGGAGDDVAVIDPNNSTAVNIQILQDFYDKFVEGKAESIYVENIETYKSCEVYFVGGDFNTYLDFEGMYVSNTGISNYGISYTILRKCELRLSLNADTVTNYLLNHNINFGYIPSFANSILGMSNTNAYEPVDDYNPATKKYVDDHSPAVVILTEAEYNDLTEYADNTEYHIIES